MDKQLRNQLETVLSVFQVHGMMLYFLFRKHGTLLKIVKIIHS